MKLTRRSSNSRLAWAGASILALLYFATSLVVVVNAFVWTATFPSLWYTVQRVIYWPFGPYMDLAVSLLGGPEISYQSFVLISRLPFLTIPVIVWYAGFRRFWRRRRSRAVWESETDPARVMD